MEVGLTMSTDNARTTNGKEDVRCLLQEQSKFLSFLLCAQAATRSIRSNLQARLWLLSLVSEAYVFNLHTK